MILLIDLGNSRLKWALWGPGEDLRGGASGLGRGGVAASLDALWAGLERPRRIVAVCVAAAGHRAALADWCQRRWRLSPEFVISAAEGFGIRNGYRHPAQLGADRWVALIAARSRHLGPCCVVDCGTAITVDALDAEGDHLGGAIMPGIALMRRALIAGTAGIDAAAPQAGAVFARDTATGVAAGVLHAAAGGVERIVRAMAERLGDPPECLLTGGDAGLLAPLLGARCRSVPDLILEGLAIVADARGKAPSAH
jgi:type III pantothenate kinase